MRYYRYEGIVYASTDHDGEYVEPIFRGPKLICNEYDIISETSKGKWIGHFNTKYKWISNTSKKKYAYPSREEALSAFILRKERQIKILENNLSEAKSALGKAIHLKNKVTEDQK